LPNDYNCPWLKQPITPASGLTPAAVPTIYDLRNTDWISVGGGETKAKPIYGIKPIFINEKSRNPSFLTYKAWDSCQGCKSAGCCVGSNTGEALLEGQTCTQNAQYQFSEGSTERQIGGDKSFNFQVKDYWMRIQTAHTDEVVNLSGHNNPKYWWNPPRDSNPEDDPLEIEWFDYHDMSDFFKGTKDTDIAWQQLNQQNWSAFWAFGHGAHSVDSRDNVFIPNKTYYPNVSQVGWPTCGEIDFCEFLPYEQNALPYQPKTPYSAQTAIHNAMSGSYPSACSWLSSDSEISPLFPDITRDNFFDPIKYGGKYIIEKQYTSDYQYCNDVIWTAGMNVSPFSWGQCKKWQEATGAKPGPANPEFYAGNAAKAMYNKWIHCYFRMSRERADMLVFFGNNTDTDIASPMHQYREKYLKKYNDFIKNDNLWISEGINEFKREGYIHVYSGKGSYGSSEDFSHYELVNEEGQKVNSYPNGPITTVGGQANMDRLYTNWHQNFAFVWSIVRAKVFPPQGGTNNDPNYLNKIYCTYKSDIKIRGGSTYWQALGPANFTKDSKIATTWQDGVSESLAWLWNGICNGRLSNFKDMYDIDDYESKIYFPKN
jgi:hypothetical protein